MIDDDDIANGVLIEDGDEYPPRHPLADKFTCPTWTKPGRCACGAKLPPQEQWHNAGGAWQHTSCPKCGMGYVDEDDFIAMYDDGLEESCRDSGCLRTRRAPRFVWISTYNMPRKFDNGIVWVRVSVRLGGWHRLGGLWFSKHRPFFRVLLPQGAKGPIL